MLAQGPRHIPDDITADIDGNLLRISCPDSGLGNMYAVPDDCLHLAVYLPAVAALMHYTGPLRSQCSQCTFELPDEWSALPAAMHVYVWFQATCFHRAAGTRAQVRPDQSSPNRYLGTFPIPTSPH